MVSGPVTTACPPGSREQGHHSVSLESMNLKAADESTPYLFVMIMKTAHAMGSSALGVRDLVLDLAVPPLNIMGKMPPPTPCLLICVVRLADPKIPELL